MLPALVLVQITCLPLLAAVAGWRAPSESYRPWHVRLRWSLSCWALATLALGLPLALVFALA